MVCGAGLGNTEARGAGGKEGSTGLGLNLLLAVNTWDSVGVGTSAAGGEEIPNVCAKACQAELGVSGLGGGNSGSGGNGWGAGGGLGSA